MSYKYELEVNLGKGGFGSVYKLKDKDVALKLVYVKSFTHLAEIMILVQSSTIIS